MFCIRVKLSCSAKNTITSDVHRHFVSCSSFFSLHQGKTAAYLCLSPAFPRPFAPPAHLQVVERDFMASLQMLQQSARRFIGLLGGLLGLSDA